MSDTHRLALPLLAAGQSEKHVTMNEALLRLDETVHLRVESRALATPPASPAEGDAYIAAAGSTGNWAGKDGELVVFEQDVWREPVPFSGMLAFVADEQIQIVFDGAAWRTPHGRHEEARIDRLGVGRQPDETAALAAATAEVLLSHATGGGDIRLVMNKAAASDTASLVLQQGWSGRGELGLCGDNKTTLKVSANGSAWTTALSADPASGDVSLPGKVVIGSGAALANGLTIARPGASLMLRDTAGTGNAHVTVASFVDAAGAEKVWMGLGSSSNSEFTFLSQYADGITFYAYGGNHPIRFLQDGATRLRIHGNGNVGVNEAAPTAPLHVGGAARVGSALKAALPSASALGAGAILFVPDDSAGATLAFSDGTAWRRVHDRQPVA